MQTIQEYARVVRNRVVELDSAALEAGTATAVRFDPVTQADHALAHTFDELALAGEVVGNEHQVKGQVKWELLGYGVLQPLLDNPEIEEIWINQPNQVLCAQNGEVVTHNLDLSTETIRTLVLRMLRNSGRRIDTSLPFADAILEDGSRLHVVIPDVTAQHWAVNIRKFPPQLYTLDKLIELGSVTASQAEYLHNAVRAGKNILISGATHSGKTTLLGALLNELPAQTRLISCEETFELRSNLPDWVAMQARQPNLEGQGEIPLRRLVKESLRMRPDRLVIGEVREAEALDLLVAMNSGVAGACTIHANSAEAAVTKLCTLPLLAGPNISPEFVQRTVAEAIDIVVQCEYRAGVGRKISQIAQVSQNSDGYPAVEVLQW